jgi:photosynthetic reaction center cytochrome c subunit
MNLVRRRMYCVVGLVMICLMGLTLLYSQARPTEQVAQKPQMSEEAFKNIQVLRGIPVKEFMETMGFFCASLSMTCTDCHGDASASDWANYAADFPLKQMARRMVLMVNGINSANFAGAREVTCYTCHRGNQRPKVVPSLAAQYAEPAPDDPDEIELLRGARIRLTADQILDKYIQAVGGAAALAKFTSFTAKGTYEGFDSDFGQVPVDVYAKVPNLRATVVHMKAGDNSTTYDGHEAWSAGPAALVPVPLVPLLKADLEGASLDAQLAFPGQIKQVLTDWRAGFPPLDVDGRPVDVIDGKLASGARIKLYFDQQTGLLVRQARFADTAVGTVATHVIYSDYRAVGGVKIPFKWQTTWVDGQSTINLTSVQPNAAVDAAKFGKPAAPR